MNKPVNLLWTGGWDSTFQLLQLLLVNKAGVKPFYLINDNRSSTGIEIRTMQRIKNHLFEKFPHTQELLQPTRFHGVLTIPDNREIEESFESIRGRFDLGEQYGWLAKFCEAEAIYELQLCIHRDDKAHTVLESMVTTVAQGELNTYRVSESFHQTDEYKCFQYYSFPLFDLSKTEMKRVSDEHGWASIMNMTWFCHNPTKSIRPCGSCSPCIYTINEGLGWRVPVLSHIKRRLRPFYLPFRKMGLKVFTKSR